MSSSGNSSRTARKAAATPPAAITWLSLTRAASDSDMRWLAPPPQRTAYFSRARSPGVVLRVSRTVALVPSSASAQARVAVAMPDSRPSRLSALRSAVSRSRVRVRTVSSTWPASTRSPSSTCRSTSNSSVHTTDKTASATRRPATTPGWRAAKSPMEKASSGTVATVVTSTPVVQVLLDRHVRDVLDQHRVESRVHQQLREVGVESALQRIEFVALAVTSAATAAVAAAAGRVVRGLAGAADLEKGKVGRTHERGSTGCWADGVTGGNCVSGVVRTASVRSGVRRTTRWRCQVSSSRSGWSSRQWQPRVSSRARRPPPGPGRPVRGWSPPSSPRTARRSCGRGRGPRRPRCGSAPGSRRRTPGSAALRSTPAPSVITRWMS